MLVLGKGSAMTVLSGFSPHAPPRWSLDSPPVPRLYAPRDFDSIPQLRHQPKDLRFAMRVVARVLPFRVNSHVIDELIDWDNVPDDPMYQLVFPQPGMLEPNDFDAMADLLRRDAAPDEVERLAWEIRNRLNPHPAGQMSLNVPMLDGKPLEGVQHKYRETVLFFPARGQTCHSYCSFCYRWAQFAGAESLRFAADDPERLATYLRRHPNVTDLLLTGGDPSVMRTRLLEEYLAPLFRPGLEHIRTVRIGTKALTYWPWRFVTDEDADCLLRLLDRLVETGRHVAIMAHVEHWRELQPAITREAIRRLRDTGVTIRTQAPLLAHINDDPKTWARKWRTEVRLGMVPYYMFVARNTGANRYFEVPLVRVSEIFRQAFSRVSGLCRTARGPSMSAMPGKIEVQGVATVAGEQVLVLRFLQARNPDWVQRPFFARYDPRATWLDQLRPAFGEERFFFEDEMNALAAASAR